MRVGEFFDALAGFIEQEEKIFKDKAELLRVSTLIIRNAHVQNEADLVTAHKMWPFPWDKNNDEPTAEQIKQFERNAELQAEYLMKHYGDGNQQSES
jgi:hypothetical protein